MLLQDWMVVLIHFYGVNLRFMGLIRNEMEKEKHRLLQEGSLSPRFNETEAKVPTDVAKEEFR